MNKYLSKLFKINENNSNIKIGSKYVFLTDENNPFIDELLVLEPIDIKDGFVKFKRFKIKNGFLGTIDTCPLSDFKYYRELKIKND